jgi:hypothetical protein
MTTQEMIPLEEFCLHHHIGISFINSMEEIGLVETIRDADRSFISFEQLPQIEKLVRWNRELQINAEGVETIHYLLKRMEEMQNRINQLTYTLEQFMPDA